MTDEEKCVWQVTDNNCYICVDSCSFVARCPKSLVSAKVVYYLPVTLNQMDSFRHSEEELFY